MTMDYSIRWTERISICNLLVVDQTIVDILFFRGDTPDKERKKSKSCSNRTHESGYCGEHIECYVLSIYHDRLSFAKEMQFYVRQMNITYIENI